MLRRWLIPVLALALPLPLAGSGRPDAGMAKLPAGSYLPLYTQDAALVRVAAFEMDRHAVTRQEYRDFVEAHPRWRRSEIKTVFAQSGYLRSWASDLDFGGELGARRPVTDVSWFAAKAYCEAQGKRLPTVDEWEYAAAASETERGVEADRSFTERLMGLYLRRTTPAPEVGSIFRNAYGLHDLHGSVWEWVLDFNSVMVSDDSRGKGARDRKLYCAASAVGTTDPGNYPAFLRYAVRAGLTGASTSPGLGFRCARSL